MKYVFALGLRGSVFAAGLAMAVLQSAVAAKAEEGGTGIEGGVKAQLVSALKAATARFSDVCYRELASTAEEAAVLKKFGIEANCLRSNLASAKEISKARVRLEANKDRLRAEGKSERPFLGGLAETLNKAEDQDLRVLVNTLARYQAKIVDCDSKIAPFLTAQDFKYIEAAGVKGRLACFRNELGQGDGLTRLERQLATALRSASGRFTSCHPELGSTTEESEVLSAYGISTNCITSVLTKLDAKKDEAAPKPAPNYVQRIQVLAATLRRYQNAIGRCDEAISPRLSSEEKDELKLAGVKFDVACQASGDYVVTYEGHGGATKGDATPGTGEQADKPSLAGSAQR